MALAKNLCNTFFLGYLSLIKNTEKQGMKTTRELVEALEKQGYPLRFIATQAGVNYTRLYRFMESDGVLNDEDAARVRRFAIVQPCIMDGAGHDN